MQIDTENDAVAEQAVAIPLRDRFAALRAEAPLPAPTGEVADKGFFDALSDAGKTDSD